MFDAARLQPGERVLDVGCGFGTTTIEAADCVAPLGRVLGVDISAAMLEPARQPVAAAGTGNIELLEADAQVHPFEAGAFDVVISRFGLMFFEDPDAAFANLARALRPDGRLVFVCWPDPMKSEWVAVALGVAVAQVGRPRISVRRALPARSRSPMATGSRVYSRGSASETWRWRP
jgi:ubiquinone/menaquinone biosynthesis C-methylase UbiE